MVFPGGVPSRGAGRPSLAPGVGGRRASAGEGTPVPWLVRPERSDFAAIYLVVPEKWFVVGVGVFFKMRIERSSTLLLLDAEGFGR